MALKVTRDKYFLVLLVVPILLFTEHYKYGIF